MCGGSWNHRLVSENFATCSHVQINSLQIKNYTTASSSSNYDASLFGGYIITKCISPTTIMADWDFMQISCSLNRCSDVICELQKVWTHCLHSLMQMTPLGAFGPEKKKDGFENSFKMLVCHIGTGCSKRAQNTCSIKEWSLHSTTESYADCVFCLVWPAGWVSHVKPTPGSGLLAQA